MLIPGIPFHEKSQRECGLWSYDAICLENSFVFTPAHCVNCKAMIHKSTSFSMPRIVADQLHYVTLS